MSEKYHHIFKVILIGDSSVGKTSMMNQFLDGSFVKNFMTTVGVDFKIKNLEIDGQIIKIQIWDTAGQERFRSITNSFYRNSHAILMVYDITNSSSFTNLSSWIGNAEKNADDQVLKYIVGNKCDCSDLRAVEQKDGQNLAKKKSAFFFETSAKENINIDSLFDDVCRNILKQISNKKADTNFNTKKENTLSVWSSHINSLEPSCC